MEKEKLAQGELLKERYRIESVLGEGAHGTVYSATDCDLEGALWAVKEIRESALPMADRAEVVAHFYREAEILKSLNHTGVPEVIDAFARGDCHYMVMEHVEGRTLKECADEEKPDAQAVVGWGLKLCDILAYLHGFTPEPLIFRDLKPSNIMVTPRGRVLLVDFGISRYFKIDSSGDTVTLGTPGYAAPEQYGTAQTDCRSDLYSLGATLYELLSGADMASFNFVIPPVSTLNPAVRPVLEGILARCLERLPENRFQSAAELRESLTPLYRKKKAGRGTVAPKPAPKAQVKIPVQACAGLGPASTAETLSPLPAFEPEVRLWNPASRRTPHMVPFIPPWLMAIIAEQEDLAIKAPLWVLVLFVVTDVVASIVYYLLNADYLAEFFWMGLFLLTCTVGVLSLGVLVINRCYVKAIALFLVFVMEYGMFLLFHYRMFCDSELNASGCLCFLLAAVSLVLLLLVGLWHSHRHADPPTITATQPPPGDQGQLLRQ